MMQWRNSRMLYSNLLLLLNRRSRTHSQFPKACSSIMEKENKSTTSHFSTIPNRPMRGGGEKGERRDDNDPSERNLNLGGGGGGGGDDQRYPRSGIRGDRPTWTEKRRDFDGGDSDGEALLGKFDFAGDTFLGKLDFAGGGSGGNKGKEARRSSTPRPVVVQEQAVEDADEIFKKMKETGLIPNAVAMLDGLCKDGLVQEAMKLFGTMREKGTVPEVVIYTAVVEGFCRAAKFDDAKRIFRKMQKNEIVPNAFSYGVLIQGLSKGKRLEDAVEFCMEMLEAGHVPNAATLTGLVDGFCKEKGAEEGEGFVRSLRERGFAIDEKAVREHLDKKGPYSLMVWEAIFGKNARRPF